MKAKARRINPVVTKPVNTTVEETTYDTEETKADDLLGESPLPSTSSPPTSPRPSSPGEPPPILSGHKIDCCVSDGSSCCIDFEGTSVTKHWCTFLQALAGLFVSHQAMVPPLARIA